MAKMTEQELKRYQEQQAQAEREKRDLIARMGRTPRGVRTPAPATRRVR